MKIITAVTNEKLDELKQVTKESEYITGMPTLESMETYFEQNGIDVDECFDWFLVTDAELEG